MSPPPPLQEEVFFRLPPDEPEHILCASLVSKVWLRLLFDPRFRASYRDFHGAPPMLGFLSSCLSNSVHVEAEDNIPHLLPTTKFRVRIPDDDWGGRTGAMLLGSGTAAMPAFSSAASLTDPFHSSFGTP
ncbi:hypothetical protein VPH35_126964 [Triticum aestivum]